MPLYTETAHVTQQLKPVPAPVGLPVRDDVVSGSKSHQSEGAHAPLRADFCAALP